MKKSNPMLNNLFCQTKKFLVCLVTISMVLSLNSAFLFNVVKAQEDVPPPVMDEPLAPSGEEPTIVEPPTPGEPPRAEPATPAIPATPAEPGQPGEKATPAVPAEPAEPAKKLGEEELPPEVWQDMQVTIEDLGAKPARLKPDSFWHPFKQLGRNIHEALVFDPVNDAELKLQHANQELAEIKQLVEEKGMENVDPEVLTSSVDWFENKLEKIKDAAENIKDKKGDKPDEVEALLNDFTDKHFYEHKILEEFDEKVTEAKNQIAGAEDVYVALKDKQDEVLEDFGSLLTVVDEPDKIPERLAAAANAQEGSEFKLIKATEILKKLEEQVPEQAKDAIEQAQEKTMKLLEEDMGELAPIVRAEKFEQYTAAMPGDETIHLNIFEQLKQMPDIPQDMLEKIEQVKEFTVQKFEKKIEKFEKKEIKDKFFEKLTGDDLSDIMVLEELKAKITAKQEELRKRVEQQHNDGLETFKKQFTDLQSQEQAKRFEKLVKEMTTNPNPKILQLIQELETEVAQDPEKAAFIGNIKNKTKAEFENKFRQEGERFFDRVSTLNPRDMMVFQEFKAQEFFDPKMMDEFFSYQTERFKQYIQNIDNSESFDRFQERFRYVPQQVIETIKTQDESFGELMQFKSRKMEEMQLEKKEREVTLKMNEAWRQMGNEFQNKLSQASSDEARKTLFEEKRQKDLELVEKEYTERYALMKERMMGDPFCDEKCREIQIYYFDQEFTNKKNNIMQEGLKRDFETSMKPELFGNPFVGKCDKPEDCLVFCQTNPDFSACKMFASSFTTVAPTISTAQGQVEPGMKPLIGPPPCPPGQINMPRGPSRWECVDDPYWKTPENFKQCPPGRIWNEQKGFCEFKTDMFKPVTPTPGPMPPSGCPAGERWDPERNSCIREQGQYMTMPINYCGPAEHWDNVRGCVREDFKKCGPNEYFDFYEQRCLGGTVCPAGEYWDPGRDSCIKDVFVPPTEQCKPGYFWDYYKKQCVEDKYQPPTQKEPIACPMVMPGPCKPGETPTYGPCGPSCTPSSTCPSGQWWDSAKNTCVSETPAPYPTPQPAYCTEEWQPVCGTNNVTYSNECYAKKAGVGIKFRGECTPTPTPMPSIGYCGDGVCKNGETMSSCPKDCGGITTGYCGDGSCQSYESSTSCPSDCGGGNIPCSNYATLGQGCNPSTGTCCSEGTCSNSNGPGSCISTGSMTCNYNGTCDNGETIATCPKDCGGTTGCPSTIYNNYTTGFACNYTKCPNGCNLDYQGCPNGCMSYKGYCGDNVCDSNETANSCPSDCGGTGTCPSTKYNNYTTGFACSYSACPNGCTFDSKGCPNGCSSITAGSCGDGVCNPNETITSCPSDCGGITTCPVNSYTTSSGACNYTTCPNGCNFSNGCPSGCSSITTKCGNGICEGGETTSSCPSDCSTSGTCPSTIYNNYTTGYTCNYTKCPTGCNFDMQGCPTSCMTSTTGYCGNGICDSNETSSSCPSDCGSGMTCPSTIYNNYTTGFACNYTQCPNGCTFDYKGCPSGCSITPPPSTTGYCGDGTCNNSETTTSCPNDCGGYTPPPSSVCGNGMCEGSEDSYSCPNDCGAPPPPTETPPPPAEPPPGEVLGVMSVREIDEISNKVTLTVFEKSAQILSAIFNHDKPAKAPTILVYLPRSVLKANPMLKERMLWAEGNNYYRLVSYAPPKVLGVKTPTKVKFPLVTVWEILTSPF